MCVCVPVTLRIPLHCIAHQALKTGVMCALLMECASVAAIPCAGGTILFYAPSSSEVDAPLDDYVMRNMWGRFMCSHEQGRDNETHKRTACTAPWCVNYERESIIHVPWGMCSHEQGRGNEPHKRAACAAQWCANYERKSIIHAVSTHLKNRREETIGEGEDTNEGSVYGTSRRWRTDGYSPCSGSVGVVIKIYEHKEWCFLEGPPAVLDTHEPLGCTALDVHLTCTSLDVHITVDYRLTPDVPAEASQCDNKSIDPRPLIETTRSFTARYFPDSRASLPHDVRGAM